MDDFAKRLRKYRMAKNLSLQVLAEKVGSSKAHIWDLEQGKTKNPSLSLLTNLSRALDVPIKTLVGEASETEDDDALAPLFRDLRELEDRDIELIKSMTEQLRSRKNATNVND
jgi:transcriptional regulator with XRE-family HTH domain|tara:strand:+ start:389 stop:727 length:339 start_codon:yes stop_codon:yes gene_type:complete